MTNCCRHDNRYTHESHLVSSGLSLEIVGQLLRHTITTTTERYVYLADDPLHPTTERFGSKIAGFQNREKPTPPPFDRERDRKLAIPHDEQ